MEEIKQLRQVLKFVDEEYQRLGKHLEEAEARIEWLITEKIMPEYRQNLDDMHRYNIITYADRLTMAREYEKHLRGEE